MPEPPLLAQLAREPVPGHVKTRMLPRLSPEQAADLHAAMVESICRTLCDCGIGRVQLWVDGEPEAPLFRRCLEMGVASIETQCGEDLGRRMAHICRQGLANHPAVVLVGSDAPALNGDYIRAAVTALAEVDVVLGPALDGGYVLLGLGRYVPELFEDIPWGTDSVLSATLSRLKAVKRSYHLLEPLPDIDRPADLRHVPDGLWTVPATT